LESFAIRWHSKAIFVDGCYWHGCPLHATSPKTNAAFWRKKLAANRTRDHLVTRTLRQLGWRVLRLWEHELKPSHEHKFVRRLFTHLGRSA
jgi:DNA mismatch endonuclease (patch repair protein)